MSSESSRSLPAARAVALVTGRELSTRMRNKVFVLSNVVLLALIAGGIVLASVLMDSGDPVRIGVVGQAQSLTSPLTTNGEALETPVMLIRFAPLDPGSQALSPFRRYSRPTERQGARQRRRRSPAAGEMPLWERL